MACAFGSICDAAEVGAAVLPAAGAAVVWLALPLVFAAELLLAGAVAPPAPEGKNYH